MIEISGDQGIGESGYRGIGESGNRGRGGAEEQDPKSAIPDLVATLILLPQAATDARITLATLVIVGLLLTYGLMRIAPFVLEVNLRIKVG